MRFVFDVDGTICIGKPYKNAEPLPGVVKFIQYLKQKGHQVIIYTARGMGSSGSNHGKAMATQAELLIKQLKNWGVEYDELYLGKPNGDFFIDDKAINANEIHSLENVEDFFMENVNHKPEESQQVLSFRLSLVETRLNHIETKLDRALDLINESRTKDSLLEQKFISIAESLKTSDDVLKKDIISLQSAKAEHLKTTQNLEQKLSDLRVSLAEKLGPGALAGGTVSVFVSIIIELVKYMTSV